MIGLKRHLVRVVDHDPGWAALSACECEVLRRALGDLVGDIQHVGSKAVPGLPAKPILDIAVAARTPDLVPAIVNVRTMRRAEGREPLCRESEGVPQI